MVAQRGVAEQGADGGQARCGPRAVAAVVFEVIQDRADHGASKSAIWTLDGGLPVCRLAKASSSLHVSR